MSNNKMKEFSATTRSKLLCGLFLKNGEKNRLHQICIKYEIPIKYPNLFSDDTHYSLWGISENGIGLIGTIIMNYLQENNGTIFNSLDELEEYLKRK